MTIKSILLSGAVALACVTGVTAQTAKDYARYSTYTAPRAQGQNVNGMHVFIFGGLKSHGPGAHDYPYFMDTWSKLLTAHGAVVDGAFSFPSQEQLDHSDVVIIYKGDAGYMTPEQRARLQAYVKRGGGLVTFHDSLCGPDPADMATWWARQEAWRIQLHLDRHPGLQCRGQGQRNRRRHAVPDL